MPPPPEPRDNGGKPAASTPRKTERTALEEKLVEQYGDPFFFSEKGNLTINERYWAGLHAAENIILYEPDEGAFFSYDPDDGCYHDESTDALRSKIAARLLKASRAEGGYP